jgi:hypothetical protein
VEKNALHFFPEYFRTIVRKTCANTAFQQCIAAKPCGTRLLMHRTLKHHQQTGIYKTPQTQCWQAFSHKKC